MTRKIQLKDVEKDGQVAAQLQAVSQTLNKAKKIVFVTGAGISCSAGIPDFRSENGLYSMVKSAYPNAVVKGKDLFDAVLFSNPVSTSVFCTFMARLRSCILDARPTPVHKFIKLLHDKKKLLRCYTQNIDGLESRNGLRVGVESKNTDVVQLHGDIHQLKCTLCGHKVNWSEPMRETLEEGMAPECPNCFEKAEERTTAGKRCPRVGCMRPDIVLYGEDHPDGDIIGRSIALDIRARPDCLIIAGTSLKVLGIRKLVRAVAKTVHEKGGKVIFVNQTGVASSMWNDVIDWHVETDCDTWIEDLRMRSPELFFKQASLTTGPAKSLKATKQKSTEKVK
ncbi:DHS-like NAD/FAD-binding domain-containing protein, partial [Lipomyces japonicus]|uniref:DHS-like NAD/FAD-binding domain-containing protein n=1 Tax=Lipomyces japonicus TaxID=56871 RepID=UPI0034CDD9CC